MLATVFFMQPVGQLLGNIVAIVAVAKFRDQINHDADPLNCTGSCLHAVDQIWRWVVGFGAIPPIFAVGFRLWIPESPRYTFEVERDPTVAQDDVNRFFPKTDDDDDEAAAPVEDMFHPMEMVDINGPAPPLNEQQDVKVQKVTWLQYWTGLREFLFKAGHGKDLLGTALAWFMLDFCFYFLGVNSPKIIRKLWDSPDYKVVYPMLMEYSWRTMIASTVPALIGGAVFIYMAKFRHQIQQYGFIILGALFVAVGVCIITLLGGRYFAAIIVLYALCNLFFDLGPNTSTFIVSRLSFRCMRYLMTY
jgi:MFS transporter, PHS family, inorganic phosphate transporter